ncbi:unnamed protein product [Cylicostephanus goldi]|uniref:Far11/STRP C-terminal domain-containing protein n=1 Tax=Cylicostephanus goldi TaxID=71465 RepID=A0A3P7MAA8_CYLGO|nr:unnamed protein product [Cylicostephanus goldi]
MMLMVFKSAPILKRSLKIRLGLFQFFILKALKMQSRYLGRQWRKSNMDIILSSKATAPTSRIPAATIGVKKTKPFEALLDDYAKFHWDDTVTDKDPLVVSLRERLLKGDRSALASAITLVESRNPRKRAQGNLLLHTVLAAERKRYEEKGKDAMIFRIGISGSPGVGKSSFIEALGKELTENRGMKIAVLTIDPSSSVTGGIFGFFMKRCL